MTQDELIDGLKAVAHPVRLRILQTLSGVERNVGEIDDAADIGQPTLSQQLAVLRNAGLVTTRKDAKLVFYRIDEERLGAISTALGGLAGIDRAPPPSAPRKAPGVANFARLG
ncbi:ArsR/SmtB family transcription factor [Qipengyuania flava]|uniref:ArsR/SmtB family transcription factor n=1 Tax=Qipengyuania flava TaxID=192812 RepID=UPI003BB014B5